MGAARQYSLVFVGGEGSALTAPSLPLVAALIALDCHPRPESPVVETLEDISPDGAPEPLVKHEHRWIFGDRSGCGRYHTDALRKHWISADWLASNPTHPLTRIRAAFHVAGVLPIEHTEWLDSDPAHVGRFVYDAFQARELEPDWRDADFRAANRAADPERAAVADAFAVLDLLRAELAKLVPLMVVRKGQKRALIPIDATPEEEARLLSRIDNTNQA